MKGWKGYFALAAALGLSLSLAACGGNGGNDDAQSIPEAFEGLEQEDFQSGYGMYAGYWEGDDSERLVVEVNDESTQALYGLYDFDNELYASGFIQYVQEYGADYFYNENDGWAHHVWMDEDGVLQIDTFGSFRHVTDAEGEEWFAKENNGITDLAGVWYLDGEENAAASLEIDENGIWSLYEPDADGSPVEVDYGTIEVNPEDVLTFYAISDAFEDTVYDFYLGGDNVIYWGGEADYYERI